MRWQWLGPERRRCSGTCPRLEVAADEVGAREDVLNIRPAVRVDGGGFTCGDQSLEHPHVGILEQQAMMVRSGSEGIELRGP